MGVPRHRHTGVDFDRHQERDVFPVRHFGLRQDSALEAGGHLRVRVTDGGGGKTCYGAQRASGEFSS